VLLFHKMPVGTQARFWHYFTLCIFH